MIAAALTAAFVLTSPAFHNGDRIPVRYTCEGANVSPALRWTAPPRATRALSLTVFDPDAPGGGFLHWRVAKIPAAKRSLPSGSPGWTGPCPPSGPAHHYVFTLRALGAKGKMLATARLTGTFKRA